MISDIKKKLGEISVKALAKHRKSKSKLLALRAKANRKMADEQSEKKRTGNYLFE